MADRIKLDRLIRIHLLVILFWDSVPRAKDFLPAAEETKKLSYR